MLLVVDSRFSDTIRRFFQWAHIPGLVKFLYLHNIGAAVIFLEYICPMNRLSLQGSELSCLWGKSGLTDGQQAAYIGNL